MAADVLGKFPEQLAEQLSQQRAGQVQPLVCIVVPIILVPPPHGHQQQPLHHVAKKVCLHKRAHISFSTLSRKIPSQLLYSSLVACRITVGCYIPSKPLLSKTTSTGYVLCWGLVNIVSYTQILSDITPHVRSKEPYQAPSRDREGEVGSIKRFVCRADVSALPLHWIRLPQG
jgi:hypothetical protein